MADPQQDPFEQAGFVRVADPSAPGVGNVTPLPAKPKEVSHYAPLPANDPRYNPNYPNAQVNTDSNEVSFGNAINKGKDAEHGPIPAGWEVDPVTGEARPIRGLPSSLVAGNAGQAFVLGDPEAINHGFNILDNISKARQLAKQPLATGTSSASVANIPGAGIVIPQVQNRADLQTNLQGIGGDLQQIGMINLYKAMGGKGISSMLRSSQEQQAIRASLAPLGLIDNGKGQVQPGSAQPSPDQLNSGLDQAQGIYERHIATMFGMDPNNPLSLQIVKAAEANPANRQALIQAYHQNGGALPNLRFVTKADGKDIPPILVPHDASDEDVRNAVRAVGHNVAPNTMIINGSAGGTPPAGGGGAPQGGKPQGWLGTADDALVNGLSLGLMQPATALLNSATGGGSFDRNLAGIKAQDNASYAAHPVAGWAGTIASLLAPIGIGAKAKLASEAPGAVSRLLGWLGGDGSLTNAAVRAPVVAAPIGAVEGAANAGEGNRTSGAVRGGLTAAAVAPLALPLAAAGGKAIGWLGSKIFPEMGAWAALHRIAPEADPQAMAAEAERLRAAGQNPAAIDTVNPATLDQVRNVVGGRTGSKAASILNQEADARAAAAPSRAASQARAAIGASPEGAAQVAGQQAAPLETRMALGQKRDDQFAATINPIRNQKIDLPHDTAAMLSGGDMGAVIRAARGYTNDPHERESLNALAAWADQSSKTGLSDGVPPIEIGAADALRQALNAAGSVKQADASHVAMRTAASALTSGLESMAPRYAEAMNAYRAQSSIAAPARGSGEVSNFGAKKGEAIDLGESVVGANAEQHGIKARNLPPLDEPVTYAGQNPVSITPRQAAGEGVVRAVEQKAKNGQAVVSLGKQMQSPEQQRVLGTVLTPQQTEDLAKRIGIEGDRVSAANRAAPASAPAAEDPSSGISAAAAIAYHSPAMKGAKMANLLNKAQISVDQADRIAKGVVDPKETNTIIRNLQKAGYAKDRAKQVYSMIAYQLAVGAGRGVTGGQPPPGK